MEQTKLPDGVQHQAYLELARFYGKIDMYPDETAEQIFIIDNRHRIDNPDDINRLVEYAKFNV